MRDWLAAAFVAFACASAPLFAPGVWAQHGAFPDVAAIAVLYLAICGTPERAAVLGVTIGIIRCAFTPEPFGLDAALYGTLGWSGAHFGRAVFEDRVLVKMAAAGLGVVAVRGLSAGAASLVSGGAGPAGGMSMATFLPGALCAGAATAVAAPLVFAALSSSRVLAAFERRRKHDV